MAEKKSSDGGPDDAPPRGLSSHVMTSAGVRMPRMIYGCAWKKERTEELVAEALSRGFSGFDTAAQPKHYFEAGAGAGLARFLRSQDAIKREHLFVQTKFNKNHGKTLVPDTGASIKTIGLQVERSLAQSLTNLGVSYVDSLVLHSP